MPNLAVDLMPVGGDSGEATVGRADIFGHVDRPISTLPVEYLKTTTGICQLACN